LYRYEHHVLPSFERYIVPYMEVADIVVNNNETFDNGLNVLLGFIESKIK
jgi:uridine kinase